MQIRDLSSIAPPHPVQAGFFILLASLLVFGENFSKFHLFGPFHLYDALLLILGIFAFFTSILRCRIFINKVFLLFAVSSLAYLAWSFLFIEGPLDYTVRHFAIFGYPILVYIIFFSYANEKNQQFNIRFIALMGVAAFILQIGNHFYLAVKYPDIYKLFGTFNYYSKMSIMGVIVSGAYLMVYIRNKTRKGLAIAAYIFMSVTLGHASAFMAAFAVFITYIFLRVNPVLKVAVVVQVCILIAIFYFYLPQFSDVNARFRSIYWGQTVKELFTEGYGFFGKGFGVKFVSRETLDLMRSLNNPWMEYRPEEQYLTSMHNSFLTYAFHIGLIPSLLLFLPLRKPILYYLSGNGGKTRERDFLILALVGVMVWSSFNIVLELPHSSGFFWLIYFAVLYSFGSGKYYKLRFS